MGGGGGKGKSDPPDPPDYEKAAQAQGAANKETAIASSMLNNPNVVNPYGTQTWTDGSPTKVLNQEAYDNAVKQASKSGQPLPDPANFYTETGVGRPTLTQTLSPEQQALYAKQTQAQGNLGDLAISGSGALRDVIGQNLDLSGAPAAPGSADATRQKVIAAMMGRADEDYGRQRDQANSDLVAAGIAPGTKAYADRMQMIERSRNDARTQAELAGGAEAQRDFGMDTQARKDAIAEILASRQTPLNEITALLSGSQVSNPFAVPGASQNTNIAPPPIFGAAEAQYGAQMDAYNAQQQGGAGLMSGLFSLGSAGIKAYPWGV